MRKNIAVILAGGKGSRFGTEKPKQFAFVGGKSIIERTISRFNSSDFINEVLVVIHKEYVQDIESIVLEGNYIKVKHVINGGKTRSDSSINAIKFLENRQDTENINLLLHDAARPFVSDEIIKNVCTELETHSAVNVAVPVTDTIIKAENEYLAEPLNRNILYSSQTPQAFRFNIIKKAYKIAIQDANFQATDDAGVVAKYLSYEKIKIIQGNLNNIKITYENDIILAEYILKSAQ